MGSKIKLLDFIIPEIEAITKQGDKILDIMSGTQAISYALKKNHPIISNDIQEYSSVVAKAFIENNKINITASDIKNDILNKLDNHTYTLFSDLYTDTYFSGEQCKEIDAIYGAIARVSSDEKKNIYLTALIYAMCYCQSSTGHFAQYMPKDHIRVQALRNLSIRKSFLEWLKNCTIEFSTFQNSVLNMDYRELLDDSTLMKDVKLVYLDPPYSEAQYSRFYHILETLVKYDYPKVAHKGLYRGDRFQSNFCYRNKAREEFEHFIAKVASYRASTVISYSNKGLVSIDTLLNITKKHYSNVKLCRCKYKHSMQGRGMTNKISEILIIASKPITQ